MPDPLTRLADLTAAEPDTARAERVRMRCRARLARQAPRAPVPPAFEAVPGRVWQAVMVVIGVSYMTEVIIQALRVYGVIAP